MALPQVLGLSYEANLKPKLYFLQAELNLSLNTLRQSIVSYPARLGYSLERRYRPRLRACRLAGADVEAVIRLAARTDARFCDSIGLSLEDYQACREDG